MNIARAGALSAIATIARLLSGLVVIKLMAWLGGPEGVGKMGQFMSLMSLLSVLAGGGIGSGLVKYVAEYRGDQDKLRRLLGAGVSYALVTSFVIWGLIVWFSAPLTIWLLGDMRYQSLIWVLALVQPLIAANNYIVSVINGFMDVRRVVIIYISGAVLSIVTTIFLAFFFQIYGVLLALMLGQAAQIAVNLPVLRSSGHFNLRFLRLCFDRVMMTRLFRFSLMSLTSALLVPLVNIYVRTYLAARFTWEQVGYWQAVSKVSEAYLLFITMAIGVYYLPKISAITNRMAFEAELRDAYRHIMPVVVILALAVYILRHWVTTFLFSPSFVNAEILYGPQLIGDVIKIASWILSYIMLARAMTAAFLFSELFFSASYVGLVYLLTWRFGLVGAMYAFAANYAVYFVFAAIVIRNYFQKMPRGQDALPA